MCVARWPFPPAIHWPGDESLLSQTKTIQPVYLPEVMKNHLLFVASDDREFRRLLPTTAERLVDCDGIGREDRGTVGQS